MNPAIQTISLYPSTSAALSKHSATTSSVPTLLAISHSLEETVTYHTLDGIFYAGFQNFSAFLPQVNRFRYLASRCKKVYVFGYPNAAVPPIENLEYIALEENAPLIREWFIVFQSETFSAALLTRQIGTTMHGEFGRGRLYQGLLTLEDAVVAPLGQLLASALGLQETPTHSAKIPQPVSTYIQEFSGYMERAQGQLTNLYQNLSNRTAALERMEGIVRTMISRQAWDDALLTLETPDTQSGTFAKRTLSIMFTDIENFTPLFKAVNVAELTTQLNKYFNIIATVIYQHHGDIDKFLGDGMLAFFEDPHEALQAAIEIQTRLAYFNTQNAAHLSLQLNTRLGIATGECIIARIGSNDRRETTLIGDAVNMASRLQTHSPTNGIALDEVTYQRTGMSLRFAGRDVNVKGKGIERIYTLDFESLHFLKK
ncbi:MAG: DICT sensory domain-containing protein [Chloroflexi bacterium]|nr:DICT sensory domain-containing protein [Chloroflexota bacterium]